MRWWGRSSKEGMRKAKEGNLVDTVHAKFRIVCEEKEGRPGVTWRHNVKHQHPSPSLKASCSRFFSGKSSAQPVPLQGGLPYTTNVNSRIGKAKRAGRERGFPPSLGSFSGPGLIVGTPDGKYIDMEFMTVSISRRCDEINSKSATNYPSSLKLKGKAPMSSRRNSRPILRPSHSLMNSRRLSLSPKRQLKGSAVLNVPIPPISTSLSAPNSSTSSPLVTPRRVVRNEPLINSEFGSGQSHEKIFLPSSGCCSTPGSEHIPLPSHVGGDVPELIYSPTLSSKMECSGSNSRLNSDAVTPLHPYVAGASPEFQILWPDGRNQPSHRLPLPPLTTSSPIPVSPPYSISTNSQVPQSLFQADSLPGPGTRWKKGQVLGRGTFGQVFLGFNSENGKMCAMKEVTLFSGDRKSQESANQLAQEIALLSQLHHPNIVQYYGSDKYVSGGSIHRVLQNYGPLGEAVVRSFTRQILSGLAYLHAKNTMHRDVKGANILLQQPGGCVKLANFGMAKHITRETGPMSFKGSPYWIAPEVIRSGNADVSVDIWSLGCTIIEMATGKPPWSQYEEVAALFKIANTNELPPIPDFLSEEGKDFIRKCLQRDPLQRPTAAQLLDHPFLDFSTPIENLSPQSQSPRNVGATRLSPPILNPHPQHMSGIRETPSSSTPVATGIVRPCYHPLSPKQRCERLAPSPISSPQPASASLKHLAGGNASFPSHTKSRAKNMHRDQASTSSQHSRNYAFQTSTIRMPGLLDDIFHPS